MKIYHSVLVCLFAIGCGEGFDQKVSDPETSPETFVSEPETAPETSPETFVSEPETEPFFPVAPPDTSYPCIRFSPMPDWCKSLGPVGWDCPEGTEIPSLCFQAKSTFRRVLFCCNNVDDGGSVPESK